jgi:hypothetical protein
MRAISFSAEPHEQCGRSRYSRTWSMVTSGRSKRLFAVAELLTLDTEPVGEGGRGVKALAAFLPPAGSGGGVGITDGDGGET